MAGHPPEDRSRADGDTGGLMRVAAPIRRARNAGQVLAAVAVMTTALLGIVALVTDTSMIWINRRHLQNAVDAAALAGAQQLPDDAAGARTFACTYGTENNYVNEMTGKTGDCAGKADVTLGSFGGIPNTKITVTAYKHVKPFMAGIFGWGGITIGAHATAIVGSVGSACTVPFFQTQDLLESSGVWGGSGVILNKPTVMKTDSSASNSGNFLALRVGDSSSASVFSNAISDVNRCLGPNAPQTSGDATSNTGNMVGPFDSGMQARQAKWQTQGNCTSPFVSDYLKADGNLWNGGTQLTPETCYRMVTIPIMTGNAADYNGTTTAKIKGFAMFYISNWCGNSSTPKVKSGHCDWPATVPKPSPTETFDNGELWGYYVGFVAGGTDYVPYDGFGTKVVALID